MQEIHSVKPQIHVFICTRSKEQGESCGSKGSSQLREDLKKWAKEKGYAKDVKVTASLCLGHCESGITACIHPQNLWYLKIDASQDMNSFKNKISELVDSLKRS